MGKLKVTGMFIIDRANGYYCYNWNEFILCAWVLIKNLHRYKGSLHFRERFMLNGRMIYKNVRR